MVHQGDALRCLRRHHVNPAAALHLGAFHRSPSSLIPALAMLPGRLPAGSLAAQLRHLTSGAASHGGLLEHTACLHDVRSVVRLSGSGLVHFLQVRCPPAAAAAAATAATPALRQSLTPTLPDPHTPPCRAL